MTRKVAFLLRIFTLLFFGALPPAWTEAQTPTPPNSGAGTSSGLSSEVDQLSSLRSILSQDRERLGSLKKNLSVEDKELELSSAEFERLNRAAQAPGGEPEKAAVQQAAALAKERYELAFERRKTLAQQITVLEEKIRFAEQKIAAMLGESIDEYSKGGPAAQPEPTPVSQEASAGAPSEEPAPGIAVFTPDPKSGLYDAKINKTRKEFEETTQLLQEAEARIQALDRAIDVFEKDVRMEKELLETARAGQANAEKMIAIGEGENAARAESRIAAAAREIETRSERIEFLEKQLRSLQRERETIVTEAKKSEKDARSARRRLIFLDSPFAPARLARWMLSNGLLALAILLLTYCIHRISMRGIHRLVRPLVSVSVEKSEENEERAETLARVARTTVGLVIISVGTLAALQAAGVSLSVLLGGAAFVGMAFALASQNVIKDYFAGFMILAENQYSVGDVVRIGSIAGLVENVSLRMTTLRDLEGVVHFIPHGQVTTVSNLTHGWSCAVLEVGIAYKENVDYVMQVLYELGIELRSDPKFGPSILQDLEMLGVDQLADSQVVIKLVVRTKPLQQWKVKRELLRRIKLRFDQLGIEIPFPQRMVHTVQSG